jgi:predicted  nucleic acid-binding Zn-ribbon protein
MRVPAGGFTDALRELRELGTVEVQRIEGQDVTAQYVDLQARIRIARARRAVLLELMNEARTIQQTIRVQNALDETQLRIEELQGQLNLLDDRTSLATIRVDLHEAGVRPEPTVEKASIPNALERAVAGFVAVIAAIVVGLGYLTPLLLIGLVAWAVVILVRRRRG